MILLTAWRNHYRLGRPSEFLEAEGWIPMNEPFKVRAFLRDARRFPHFMESLRDLFRRDDRRFKSVFDDTNLVDLATDRVYFGEWRLMYRAVEPTPMSVVMADEAAGPAVEEAPPLPAREPPPPPEPSTLEPGSDAARIAQTMKEASEAGLPFCEECMKAAARQPPPAAPAPAAREAAPESAGNPEDAPFSENADEERIAESKKAAAQQGVPFCEECQRAAAAEAESDQGDIEEPQGTPEE